MLFGPVHAQGTRKLDATPDKVPEYLCSLSLVVATGLDKAMAVEKPPLSPLVRSVIENFPSKHEAQDAIPCQRYTPLLTVTEVDPPVPGYNTRGEVTARPPVSPRRRSARSPGSSGTVQWQRRKPQRPPHDHHHPNATRQMQLGPRAVRDVVSAVPPPERRRVGVSG